MQGIGSVSALTMLRALIQLACIGSDTTEHGCSYFCKAPIALLKEQELQIMVVFN